MLESLCCNDRVLQARAKEGWWHGDKLVFEWYECTLCKKKCDIMEIEDDN